MTPKDQFFMEAAKHWDLDRLYKALSEAKKKVAPQSKTGLTPTEKFYLRGLLCGHSPADIARKLSQTTKGAEVFVCNTLYQYIKNLVNAPTDIPVKNWRTVCDWLEESGYKVLLSHHRNSSNSLPIDGLIKIIDMGYHNQNTNTLIIDINIRLELPADCDWLKNIKDTDKNV